MSEDLVTKPLLAGLAAEMPAMLALIDLKSGRLLNPNGTFAIFDQHPTHTLGLR